MSCQTSQPGGGTSAGRGMSQQLQAGQENPRGAVLSVGISGGAGNNRLACATGKAGAKEYSQQWLMAASLQLCRCHLRNSLLGDLTSITMRTTTLQATPATPCWPTGYFICTVTIPRNTTLKDPSEICMYKTPCTQPARAPENLVPNALGAVFMITWRIGELPCLATEEKAQHLSKTPQAASSLNLIPSRAASCSQLGPAVNLSAETKPHRLHCAGSLLSNSNKFSRHELDQNPLTHFCSFRQWSLLTEGHSWDFANTQWLSTTSKLGYRELTQLCSHTPRGYADKRLDL